MGAIIDFHSVYMRDRVSESDLELVASELEPLLYDDKGMSSREKLFYAAQILSNLSPTAKEVLEDSGFTISQVVEHYTTHTLEHLRANPEFNIKEYSEVSDALHNFVPSQDPNRFETYDDSLQTIWTSQSAAKRTFEELQKSGHTWTKDATRPIISFVHATHPLTELRSARDLCNSLGSVSELLPAYPLVHNFARNKKLHNLKITPQNLFGFVAWVYSNQNPDDFRKKVPPFYINDYKL